MLPWSNLSSFLTRKLNYTASFANPKILHQKMAQYLLGKFHVDTRRLSELMKEAVEHEHDYRLRNDAKFRATEQKAATYAEFK